MDQRQDDRAKEKTRGFRGEYVFLGVLLFLALLAFPAFRDVQAISDYIIAICAGVGLR